MTVTLHIPSPSGLTEKEAERWRDVPVAIAVDILGGDGQIDPDIRPLNPPGRQPRLFGRAVTVLCEPPDLSPVLHALELIKPGDVLVIAAQGHRQTAMIGEILGGHLRAKGGIGLVCDGAVRDVATLSGWTDFSVFTRFVTPRGPVATEKGSVNAPVEIGGQRVSPGDLILGDDDGLVALTPELARSRIGDAEGKLAREADWVESLAKGRSVLETFGLSPAKTG